MTMRSGRAAAAAALVITLALAGCGGETDAGDVADAPSSDTTAAATATPPGPAPTASADEGDAADDREAVALPPAARSAVREGMRTMLGSLQGATAALAAGDTARAAAAAAESGMGGAGMIPPSVRETAPADFLGLGMRTHQAFGALATRASAGAPSDSLMAAVANVLEACAACHGRYRAVSATQSAAPSDRPAPN